MMAIRSFIPIAAVLAACAGSMSSSWSGGIHARMGWSEEDGLRVAEVPQEGPAHRAGLRAHDRIVAIDSEPVAGRSMADVVEMLRGPVGTIVVLSVLRGSESHTLEIDRAPYQAD
jgi:carboxyl-terminal processing protease